MVRKQKNILLVDDVKDVREQLSHVLEDEGYNVSTASNGIEAIKALSNTHIDMIITDILMPEMDGIELIAHAKKINPHELKFILISGGGRKLPDNYDYLEATKKLTGVTSLLKKPFNPDELIEMMDQLFIE